MYQFMKQIASSVFFTTPFIAGNHLYKNEMYYSPRNLLHYLKSDCVSVLLLVLDGHALRAKTGGEYNSHPPQDLRCGDSLGMSLLRREPGGVGLWLFLASLYSVGAPLTLSNYFLTPCLWEMSNVGTMEGSEGPKPVDGPGVEMRRAFGRGHNSAISL